MADMFDRLRAMTIRRLKPRTEGGNGMAGLLLRQDYVYNPSTDMNEIIESAHDISGLRATYSLRHVDGQLIRMSDVKFYLCPVLLDDTPCPTPLTTDEIQLDGTSYTIISVKNWDNAGVKCGWQVQLRTA